MNKTQETLGFGMATILGLNAVIGAGIFTYPAALAYTAGPAGLLTFLFVVLAVLAIAVAMARMSLMYPAQSIFFDHASLWAGKTGGVITTIMYVAGLMTALGLLARMAGTYIAQYAVLSSGTTWGIALFVGIICISLMGTRATKWWQLILIALTITPLILITLLCASKVSFSNLVPFAPRGLHGAIAAVKIVVFGFFGFEAVPALFALIRNPQKNVPRAMIGTVVITGLVYVAFIASIMLALPASLFTDPKLPISPFLLSLFPTAHWLVASIDWAIIITIIGTLHSMFLATNALIHGAYTRIWHVKNEQKLSRNLIIITGLCIIGGCVTITNLELSFSLISLCITGAYIATLVPLITQKAPGHASYRMIGITGIVSCSILFVCGVIGVIEALV